MAQSFTMVPIEFEFSRDSGQIVWEGIVIAGPGGSNLWTEAGGFVTLTDGTDRVSLGANAPATDLGQILTAAGQGGSLGGYFDRNALSGGIVASFHEGLLSVGDFSGSNEAGLRLAQGQSLAVSSVNTGRIAYDGATDRFKKSMDGGAYCGLMGAVLQWGAGQVTGGPGTAAGTFFLPPGGCPSASGPTTITGFGPFPGPASGSGDVGLVMPGRGFVRRVIVDPTTPGTADVISVDLMVFPSAIPLATLTGPAGGLDSGPIDAEFAAGDWLQLAWTQPLRGVPSQNILVTVYVEFERNF